MMGHGKSESMIKSGGYENFDEGANTWGTKLHVGKSNVTSQ